MGDTSDNIPKILPKCGYKTALKYSLDEELLNKKLSEKEYKEKFLLNQQLIDFSFIPDKIQKGQQCRLRWSRTTWEEKRY